MKLSNALISGTTGALVLNLLHEGVRQFRSDAPRVDLLGQRLLSRTFRFKGKKPPKGKNLYWGAMLSDLVSNSLFYSLVGWGKGRNALVRGLLLGFSAGLATLKSPEKLKLPRKRVAKYKTTRWMTIGWYTLGGIAAGWLGKLLSRR